MDIKIIEINGVSFANVSKLSKSDEKRLSKLDYHNLVYTNYGWFVKVFDTKFSYFSSRAGFALIAEGDFRKYYDFEGSFDSCVQ